MRFSDEAETCTTCAGQEFTIRDGIIADPGKFEAEPLATYHAYHVMLDGGADEDGGWAWLVGNMICEETDQGFVGGTIYETDDTARAAWERSARREHF